MIENYSSFVGFVISIVCFAIYLFFLTPKQLSEVLRPKDWLTGLRWLILSMLVVTLVTAVPSIIYQFYRSIGQNYEVLRNLSTVTSNVSKLGTTILLVLVFTYRKRG